jgi:hypothetical protein
MIYRMKKAQYQEYLRTLKSNKGKDVIDYINRNYSLCVVITQLSIVE